MTSRLFALCDAAIEPVRLAGFWSGVLGWQMAGVAGLPKLGAARRAEIAAWHTAYASATGRPPGAS
jgi:hypothetical protein